ncbi:sprT domain-containing protein [Deinococcus sp. JMULE3]|nr:MULTISPECIES: SprT-like domain-containing protein [unclassified Deinococcus]NTX99068.1 sprT domain-containing protein [Deinococcus sp. JMULE3]
MVRGTSPSTSEVVTPTPRRVWIVQSNPTPQAYAELQTAFDHFNAALFAGTLPAALITLQRKHKTSGYFSPRRFVSASGAEVHEIALNPAYFAVQPLEATLGTLVHEMVHLWQFEHGKPGRRGYHNRQWATRMIELGLHPSTTGAPGGRTTGESMSDYIVEGPFLTACRALLATSFVVTWYDRLLPAAALHVEAPTVDLEPESTAVPGVEWFTLTAPPSPVRASIEPIPVQPRRPTRVKYQCQTCQVQVWGKPGLNVACLTCNQPLSAAQD